MTPFYRGIAVAVVECAMVLSLAGKYAMDRERLPRAWAKAAPADPNLPIRGRYVSVRLEAVLPPGATGAWVSAQLSAENGQLVATPVASPADTGVTLSPAGANRWAVFEPVAFFIPEHVPDPSRRAPGEELWVEVSVPRKGPPRPVRLGVKKDGVLTPLDL
ncbi:MAG: hypothetical protein LAQ69_25825 [Acidobacteriia bacterium]|nr:hypothetical protein [Terriglobia bacterium]